MQSNPGSAPAPASSMRWSALRLLADGKTPTEISRELRLPYSTVHGWSQTYSRNITRIANNKLRNREAFHEVVARYNDIRSILGSPGAVDYSHITGGSGAQYAPDRGVGFRMIDYTVDVDNAVRATLDNDDYQFWAGTIQDKDYDLAVQSEVFLAFQERLGHEFITRGLFPVGDYFGDRP
jgi:hypothetical protein